MMQLQPLQSVTDAALSIFPSSTHWYACSRLPHEREYLRFHQPDREYRLRRGVHFAHHN